MASMDHYKTNPSFSSTLLDSIYRSIDDSEEQVFKDSMRKKQSQEDMANYQRACLIEKWMEKKRTSEYDASSFFNSSSSSSDFSSYEAESISYNSSSSCYGLTNKPKPVRTAVCSIQEKSENRTGQKPKTGGFVNTKSRALKIYTELKKARQPISPGGRLATFLNSIFTPGNTKKVPAKIDSDKKTTKSANASTCSSASSFSRSCLSKTPSSANGLKRSVRFYPVSVIVDEDCRPCGHKSLYDDYNNVNLQQKQQQQKTNKNMDLDLETVKKNIRAHVLEKNLRVEDLLRNFQVKNHKDEDEDEDEEDDDGASYASSDLFELDNLSAIGMDYQRYHEELPVYETTHLGTNRAIAKGLIL